MRAYQICDEGAVSEVVSAVGGHALSEPPFFHEMPRGVWIESARDELDEGWTYPR